MKANYHTHTWRCGHAEGTEKEYVERAIEGGIRILGFADHTPYRHLEKVKSGVRMNTDQMDDYVDTVLALKEEYKKDIEIHLGLEAEFYPEYFETLMQFLEEYPVEYLLQGQHFTGNELPGDHYCGKGTDDPELYHRYVDQVIEGMNTGVYLYLAHPDIFLFTGDTKVYEAEAKRICTAAKEKGLPLEINMLGIWDGRWYPNKAFWKVAGETGNVVVLGCDAHQPEKVWNPQAEAIALGIVKEYQLQLLESLDLE